MAQEVNDKNGKSETVKGIRALYERFPYPANHNDDARRGVGLPSHLPAIDHHIFAGKLNHDDPFRVLVAGCGTGDALVDLGKQARTAGLFATFRGIDLSEASLAIARERTGRLGLPNVHLEARHLEGLDPACDGPFDYIDCCGVLHHLEDPTRVLATIADCLAPGGGIGAMIYGELGRTGVYDAQRILHLLDAEGTIDQHRVNRTRDILAALPRRNRLRTNPAFHRADQFSDGEIADTFLHPKDRAYKVPEVRGLIESAGLAMTTFLPPFQYDPALMLPAGEARTATQNLDGWKLWELAELLSGTMRKHAFYAKRAAGWETTEARPSETTIPSPVQPMLSEILAQRKPGQDRVQLDLSMDGLDNRVSLRISDVQADLLATIDGRARLGDIRNAAYPETVWETFAEEFRAVQGPLTAIGALYLSENCYA